MGTTLSPDMRLTVGSATTTTGHPAERNLAQLTALVKTTRLRRTQYRPALPEGFLTSTGLDLTPFCNPHH
jgi:hypothetical protein